MLLKLILVKNDVKAYRIYEEKNERITGKYAV